MDHPRIVKDVVLSGVSSFFPYISERATYVDEVEEEKDVKVEELSVMPPVGSRPWCA
jgi:hypothetical protein